MITGGADEQQALEAWLFLRSDGNTGLHHGKESQGHPASKRPLVDTRSRLAAWRPAAELAHEDPQSNGATLNSFVAALRNVWHC